MGEGRVVALPRVEDEAAAGAVEALEGMLEVAREAPQRGAVVLLLGRDGQITTALHMESRLEMMGALSALSAELWKES